MTESSLVNIKAYLLDSAKHDPDEARQVVAGEELLGRVSRLDATWVSEFCNQQANALMVIEYEARRLLALAEEQGVPLAELPFDLAKFTKSLKTAESEVTLRNLGPETVQVWKTLAPREMVGALHSEAPDLTVFEIGVLSNEALLDALTELAPGVLIGTFREYPQETLALAGERWWNLDEDYITNQVTGSSTGSKFIFEALDSSYDQAPITRFFLDHFREEFCAHLTQDAAEDKPKGQSTVKALYGGAWAELLKSELQTTLDIFHEKPKRYVADFALDWCEAAPDDYMEWASTYPRKAASYMAQTAILSLPQDKRAPLATIIAEEKGLNDAIYEFLEMCQHWKYDEYDTNALWAEPVAFVDAVTSLGERMKDSPLFTSINHLDHSMWIRSFSLILKERPQVGIDLLEYFVEKTTVPPELIDQLATQDQKAGTLMRAKAITALLSPTGDPNTMWVERENIAYLLELLDSVSADKELLVEISTTNPEIVGLFDILFVEREARAILAETLLSSPGMSLEGLSWGAENIPVEHKEAVRTVRVPNRANTGRDNESRITY